MQQERVHLIRGWMSQLVALAIVGLIALTAVGARAASPINQITSSSNFLIYYGNDFSPANLALMTNFDVVVLHPDAVSVTNLTPATVAYLQSNGVGYVLAYISIGEQYATNIPVAGTTNVFAAPILKGNGMGPVYCTTNGTPTIVYENKGVADFYVDEQWNSSIGPSGAYVIQTNGSVNCNPTFDGPYIYANTNWQWVLQHERLGGLPGTMLSNTYVMGLDQISGDRVSDTDTNRNDDYSFDGFFLDTLDTAGPFYGVGYYPWDAPAMQSTVEFIHTNYTGEIVMANRGDWYFDPIWYNETFNVQPYAYTITPYINANLFESYILDSNPDTCDVACNPDVNEDIYDEAQKLCAEANRPDGFTVFALDYQMGRGSNLYALAQDQCLTNGWVEYQSPDAGLDEVGTFNLNNPPGSDHQAPVWSSTASSWFSDGPDGCPNTNYPEADPLVPRVGVQSVALGRTNGSVVVSWDIALAQTPPVKYNIYMSTNALFTSYTAFSNVVYQVGAGWTNNPGLNVANEYVALYPANECTITGLVDGTYYFRVRAMDSSHHAKEDTNTVTAQIYVGGVQYNAVAPGDILVNGSLSDWASLSSFGVAAKQFTPTTNNPVDLAQIWMAHDNTNFYVAYQNYGTTTNGLNSAYNLYFDTDLNRSTGYRGSLNNFPVGADLLLQGTTVYRYAGLTGTDWVWNAVGTANWSVAGSNVVYSLPRSWLGDPIQMNMFFYGDNQSLPGGTTESEYPASALQVGGGGGDLSYLVTDISNPVASNSIPPINANMAPWAPLTSFGLQWQEMIINSSNQVDMAQIWMAHDATNLYIAYQNWGAISNSALNSAYNLYLDTDGQRSTGYRGSLNNFPIGADYLLEGATLYQYTGTGTTWSWTSVGAATYATSNDYAEFEFPRAWLGNPSLIRTFFWGDNTEYGGTNEEIYPDQALEVGGGGAYLAYRMADVSNPVTNGQIVVNGSLSSWTGLTSFGLQCQDFQTTTTNPVDLAQLWIANDNTNFYIAYQNYGNFSNGFNAAYELLIDVDGNRLTGCTDAPSPNNWPIGADYMLQGATLYGYSGTDGAWGWTNITTSVSWATNGTTATISFPRTAIGNPAVLRVFFSDNYSSGATEATYPDSALKLGGGGGYYIYRAY